MVLRQFHCESLAVEFETERLTINRKARLAYLDDMLKESQVLQLMLSCSRNGEGKASQPGINAVRNSRSPVPRKALTETVLSTRFHRSVMTNADTSRTSPPNRDPFTRRVPR